MCFNKLLLNVSNFVKIKLYLAYHDTYLSLSHVRIRKYSNFQNYYQYFKFPNLLAQIFWQISWKPIDTSSLFLIYPCGRNSIIDMANVGLLARAWDLTTVNCYLVDLGLEILCLNYVSIFGNSFTTLAQPKTDKLFIRSEAICLHL